MLSQPSEVLTRVYDTEEIVADVMRVFTSRDYSPPTMPDVAIQLMQASWRDIEVDEVHDLVSEDPLLVGRVLRVANSPLYRRMVPVASLRQAIVTLGIGNTREVILQSVLDMKVFHAPSYKQTLGFVRTHCLATAKIAQMMCRWATIDAEYAFMCGLLHDVGIAATLIALAERPPGGIVPKLSEVWHAVDQVHAEASAVLARFWDLSLDTQLILANHHDVFIGDQPHPVAAIVALAEELARKYGHGLRAPGDRTAIQLLDEAKSILNFDKPIWAMIEVEAQVICSKIS